MDFDLIVRAGTVLTLDGPRVTDVGVSEGLIAALGPSLRGTARLELTAEGLYVLPGGIDAHVHADEPGRTSWEGFASASAALAAGGMTSFFDMPLNAHPPTLTGEAFDLKLAAAERESRLDFALWGGLVPWNLGHLAELHARGAIGFKAFLSDTGMTEFPAVDHATLREGMKRCAELGAVVALHAEDDELVRTLATLAKREGRLSAEDYLASRPPVAELIAIVTALEIAAETDCRLHFAHVSTGRGLDIIGSAIRSGMDVSAEIVGHYLVLTEQDVVRLGTLAKCSPPMRDARNRDRLWDFIADDYLIVASDHSPSEPRMKEYEDFFAAWAGITGCQSTLSLLLNGWGEGRAELGDLVAAVTSRVAKRFNLSQKGSIEVGKDADLAVVDMSEAWELREKELRYRHPLSALVGFPMRGRVRWTLSRGSVVFGGGESAQVVRGRLLRPGREQVM